MTLSLAFTKNAVVRAIEGARKAGMDVGAVQVHPNGLITVIDKTVALQALPRHDAEDADERARWLDVGV